MRAGFNGMRCLVMGGSGFIGQNLCRQLVTAGAVVRSFARNAPSAARESPGVEWSCGSLSDVDFIRKSLRDIHVVFHLVSTTLPAASNNDLPFDLTSNVLPTLNFLDLARNSDVRKIIFVSSGGTIYGIPQRVPITEDHATNPICAHGVHKLAIEKYLHLYHHLWNLDYAIVRPSNPYGVGQRIDRPQGVIAHFLQRIVTGQPLQIWGDGTAVRDYIYIDDAIDACLSLVGHQGPSRVFNIGSGKGCSLLELVSIIRDLTGKPIDIEFKPVRQMDVPVNVLDVSRAALELNWRPSTDIRTGLSRIINHVNPRPLGLAPSNHAAVRQ